METQSIKIPALFWMVILSGVALGLLTYRVAANSERDVAEARFSAEATERAVLIRNKFEVVTSTLQDLGSLYAVSNMVTGEQFSGFVTPILAREPALQALSWNPLVRESERLQHEEAIRAQGWPGYQITERLPDGKLVRASSRDHYVVVANIEPFAGNESALGFDVNSEPTRRRALEKARDEGSPAVATPIRLVQAASESRGALVFLPSYSADSSLSTPAERRRALVGYLVAVVDTPKLIAEALAGREAPGRLVLGVSSPGAGVSPLFDSAHEAGGLHDTVTRMDFDDLLRYQTMFPWGGHEVQLSFEAHEDVIANARTWAPASLMLAVFAITGFASLTIRTYSNRATKIAREVARRTSELSAANEELREEIKRRRSAEERLARSQRDLEQEVARQTTQLRSTSNQLRSILESEPECVKIVTADGGLEDMNAAGLGMIEADSIDQVRGLNVYSLIAEEHRDAFIALNRRVVGGERGNLEFEIVGLRGTRRWVETHAAPLFDPAGGQTRHLAITRDITTRKAAEAERARLEAQVRHSQKLESIGVLAGGIAHDFNNMLQVILGNAELVLQQEGLSDVTRQSLEATCEAASHAARVCGQMLTYAGRSLPTVEPVRLPEMAHSIMGLLETTFSKDTQFEIHADEKDVLVQGDGAQLSQVLMNLITNAAEAIDEKPGRIVLEIHRVTVHPNTAQQVWFGRTPPPGDYTALEVRDNGCGMDEATIERMFDPFFTTKFTGRGLGLSATLGIIQAHGGFVQVASRPGEGTFVKVLLPAITEHSSQTETEPALLPPSSNDTVLVVDDDQSVLAVGDALLRQLGYRTVLASNGEEAVERFRQDPDNIRAVLLDVTMPRLNGNATCAIIRSLRPDIPVIFCSGYANDAVSPHEHDGAFTGFLHKPYRQQDLARVLGEALGVPMSA